MPPAEAGLDVLVALDREVLGTATGRVLAGRRKHLEPVAAVGVEDAVDGPADAPRVAAAALRWCRGHAPLRGQAAGRDAGRAAAIGVATDGGHELAALAPARYASAVTCPRTSGTAQGRELRRTDG